MNGTFLTATVLEEHKVATGETLASIAADAGLSWQELANFNWGTTVPKEINIRLKQLVGCTKKTANGKNYQFDDSDEPGIIFVPQKKWAATGLPLNQRHTVRILRNRALILRLQNAQGHSIPAAEFKVRFSDGSSQTGTLGRGGAGVVRNPPPGWFAVQYPDTDDILAKSLAANARDAFDQGETDAIFRLLQHDPIIINLAQGAYNEYFNDYTGNGLMEDIYQTITDSSALAMVEALLCHAGLPTRSAATLAQPKSLAGWQEQGW